MYSEPAQISQNCDANKTALAIFSYNRPEHLLKVYQKILMLQATDRYCFHLFNDGPKSIKTSEISAVQDLTDNFSDKTSSFTIIRRLRNLGLAKSIHFGMDTVFKYHEQAIILEDDIVPTRKFFEVMEFYLENHKLNPDVGSVTGANITKFQPLEKRDFLACRRHSSWGWATWADRWLAIDWNWAENDFLNEDVLIRKVKKVSPDLVRYAELQKAGKIDSWATTMNIDFIKRNLLCVVPKQNLITNIGLDGSGTHAGHMNRRKKAKELDCSQKLDLELLDEIKESYLYNIKVRKQHSLLGDFPKGTVVRLLIKMKNLTLRVRLRS